MSSFNRPHHLYLFGMQNGKKKLAYGPSPEEAYENLKLRLTAAEMQGILKDQYLQITQRELHQHARELG
jgi:hypothetical protein